VERLRRARSTFRGWPRSTRLLVILLVLAIVPVPWMHVVDDDPPGNVWRLDGRLVIEGEVVDPPGRWSWLTVGRPPVLVEVARGWFGGEEVSARDMRDAPLSSRPNVNEPAAVAAGLSLAGDDIAFGVVVEARHPTDDAYPEHARIVRLNGIELTDREAWTKAMARGLDPIVFQTEEGEHYTAPGTLLPYERVHVDDIAPEGLDAAIAGKIARLAPVDWFRGLSLGKSHGLMVALMTYAHVSGEDLADGRHIAGTGTINGDGSVGRIGGLPSKAGAARDAGADVLVFPATQADELEDFEAAGMQLLPVLTLADAVEGLRR
jgi:hypothetical protein